MLKVLGACVILFATVGMIVSWQEGRKKRMEHLRALCVFFHRAHYAFEAENMRCIDFFETYPAEEEILAAVLEELVGMLKQHIYPTGEEAWKAAFFSRYREWGLNRMEWDILNASGKAFFGKNLSENLEQMDSYHKQISECLALEDKDFLEKKKVFTPVGLLGGIMLIIILI